MKNIANIKRTLFVAMMLMAGITAVRADQTMTAAWTQLTSGSTSGYTLSSGYYYLTSDLTFSNSTAGGNGITIDNNATVHIYIPSGVTLTAAGGNGSGQTGGGAGIYLPGNATLYLHGSGTVSATGGNAGNGSNGTNGTNCNLNFGGRTWTTGKGGNGGAGGGGAGAGIGTNGANGGNGGNGGATQSGSVGAETTEGPNRGDAGIVGGTASAMGTLYRESTVNLITTGGSASTTAGNGGSAGVGQKDHGSGWGDRNNYSVSGGGGGGGGGAGYSANGIGTGGSGGGGGAGGNGGTAVFRAEPGHFYWAGSSGGNGGTGNKNGSGGGTCYVSGENEDGYCYPSCVPNGGSSGGGAGTGSSSGSATLTDCLQYQIAYSGTGFSGTSPVNYGVSNSTTVVLPSLTGRQWKLSTYGLLCAASTSSPFIQDQIGTYSGTVDLDNVYGNIAFTTYANEHTVTMTISNYRGDGSAGSGNTVAVMKSHEGESYVDGSTMVQYADVIKLTSNIAMGYYFEGYTSTDVTIAADNTFTMPDDNVAVTATFREKVYNVIYDATSAGMAIDGQTKYHLNDILLSSVQPTKAGYTFLGWSRTQDAITADFAPGAMAGDGLNGTNHGDNVSLFAVWRANDYKVIIDPSICGGTVTANGSAKAGEEVYLTIEMDEGYTGLNELYYTVEGSTATTAIDQGTKKFTMPAGNVTVFASFSGEFTLVQDASLTQDETLTEGELYIGKTLLGSADIGRKVKLTVKSNDDKRLKNITYQKVTGTNVMRARNRAPSAGDVPIEGMTTVAADDPSVSYFSEQGVYVATINNIDGNLRVSADFEDKTDLSTVTVALQGVSPTYPAGCNPDDAGWNATVNGEAQERDVDVTISYTMSNDNNIGSQGTITVTALPNNKNYKGSKTFADQFTMVKEADDNYTIDAIPSVEYTGSTITPTVIARNNGTEISPEAITYSNNINVGTATVQAKISDEVGYVTQTFLITHKNLDLSMVTAKTITYGDDLTGNPDEVTKTTLAASDQLSSITFSSSSNLAGTYTLTLSGAVVKTTDGTEFRTDNYNIIYTAGTLTINPKAATLNAGNMTISYGSPVPTGTDFSVTADGLQYSDQLTAKPTMGTNYVQGNDVGTYNITCDTDPTVKAGSTDVTNCYTFSGTNGTLTVQAFDLRNAYIVVTDNEKGYNGSAQKATVSVYTAEGGWDITADCDICYGDTQLGQVVALSQTARGAYPITVKPATGNTNVTGQKEADESLVIGVKNISDQTGDTYDVGLTVAAQTYTGSTIEPTLADITVTYLGNDLTADQKTAEFEITDYANNLNVGTTATVSLIGENVNFSGSRTTNFEITAANLSTAVSTATYATTVRAEDVSGGNVRTVTPSANIIMMPYQGVPFRLKAEDVEVWLTGGVNKLPTADYVIKYKKGSMTYDNIDDIGIYTVVIAAGTSGNTTDAGETTLTVETQREIVVTKNEWVTYYDGKYDVAVPTGYEAYYVKSVSGSTVTVGQLSFIPKDVPALLHNSAYASSPSEEKITLAVSAATGTAPTDLYGNAWGVSSVVSSVTGNQHGVTAYSAVDGCTDYIIVKSLFVKAEPNTTVDEHRCFLRMATSGARAVYSISLDDDTTAVFDLKGQEEESEDRWYDLQGNRIGKPTKKGLYIRNGKMIVIK